MARGEQRHGGLFHDAVRLGAIGAAADDAARRVGGIRVDAGRLQSRRIRRQQMARHMPQDNGMVGRRAVEIVAVGMPLFREERIVIAESLHEFAGRNRFVLDEFPDRIHDVVYA
ncbi:MAG: hypothetical protein F4Z61_07950, partial [Acidimicrobiia bacterium]|nr:hypothetical protein [Acidimicrobiia bacterium]